MTESHTLSVRVTPEERETIERLARYLYTTGRIKGNTASDAVRFAVFKVVVPLVLKEIEERRFGQYE